MINEVILVGKLNDMEKINEYQKKIYLQIDRPFKDTYNRLSDVLEVVVWDSVFEKIVNHCNKGDLLAIKGRIQIEPDNKCLIIAENIVLLNKSKDNIYKK